MMIAVPAGVADGTPKSGHGEVEMIRMFKSVKDSAVKARTQAGNQMKALVVTPPAELPESLDGLTTSALVKRCRNFRLTQLDDPTAAAKYALHALACRYRQLDDEVRGLETEMERLTRSVAPTTPGSSGAPY